MMETVQARALLAVLVIAAMATVTMAAVWVYALLHPRAWKPTRGWVPPEPTYETEDVELPPSMLAEMTREDDDGL